MRRTTIKALLGSAVVAAAAGFSPVVMAAAEPVKVVYHVSEGNEQAQRALNNIRNHLAAEPSTKITVVALGEGIQFMLDGAKDKNGKPFQSAVDALLAQGVEFRVCNNTLNNHNVPTSKVLKEAKIVPAGVAEVARLQAQDGFVYLRP